MGKKERRGRKENKRVTYDDLLMGREKLAETSVRLLVLFREKREQRLPVRRKLRLLDREASRMLELRKRVTDVQITLRFGRVHIGEISVMSRWEELRVWMSEREGVIDSV